MEEKIISKKQNGMLVLLLTLLLHAIAIAGIIFFAIRLENGVQFAFSTTMMVISIVIVSFAWIIFLGLKVIKPQEALVLTLFGKYVGTLKTEGFYFVNPFCSAVNPAAKTKLGQSGDVNGGATKALQINTGAQNVDMELYNKKISLKIMTLNNSSEN